MKLVLMHWFVLSTYTCERVLWYEFLKLWLICGKFDKLDRYESGSHLHLHQLMSTCDEHQKDQLLMALDNRHDCMCLLKHELH